MFRFLSYIRRCVPTGGPNLTREREFERELARRPLLNDNEFYEAYYAKLEIPKQIPIRLRHIFAEQLGEPWARLRPAEKPADVYLDLPFEELVSEACEKFRTQLTADDMSGLEGSFDSLVRLLATKLHASARQ